MEEDRRSIWDLTEDEELAEDLVDTALAGVDVPEDVLPFVRVTLIGELVVPVDPGDGTLRRWAKGRERVERANPKTG